MGCSSVQSRENGKNILFVAQYNVENLFDTIDDPNVQDEDYLPSSKLKWTNERYQTKLNHLAKVISSMNDGQGPDVLTLCEVENKGVIEDLIGNKLLKKLNYGIVHHESPDGRGIDVAMIYKKSMLKIEDDTMFAIKIPSETSYITRDILMVRAALNNGQIIYVLANHWPSRRGGTNESYHRRKAAALKLKSVTDSLILAAPNSEIILTGDFNDEPFNPSILEDLGASYKENSTLYNPFYMLDNSGLGSYKYKSDWNMLDQIIFTNTSGNNLKIKYIANSASVFAESWMKETNPDYLGAPLRTYAGLKYLDGYSDHFPVFVKFELLK